MHLWQQPDACSEYQSDWVFFTHFGKCHVNFIYQFPIIVFIGVTSTFKNRSTSKSQPKLENLDDKDYNNVRQHKMANSK